MDSLREVGITTIEKTVSAIRHVQYFIYLALTPILVERLGKRILSGYDIQVDGRRPWDIQVFNRKFYARVAAYGVLGLGESFMEKWVDVKDMEGFAFRLVKNGGFKLWCQMPWNRVLHHVRWNWINFQTKERASTSCNPHYNLGNEFFEAFLDESLTYSVAYWEKATNLAEAQQDKMELAAQKMKLKPGMRVLDMGCGFGTFGKYLTDKYNVEVVGATNSIKMGEEAARRCEGHSVDIQVADWRDLKGKFDRVVCIEMVLHVGRHNLKEFFKQVNSWLKDDGLFVMQDFATIRGYPNSDDFFCKYFFPAAYTASVEEILEKSRGQLFFEHFQDMTMDTVKTDRAMFESFQKSWPRLSKIYDEKLYEAMRFYFNFGAGTAGARVFLTYQMVFRKVSDNPLPLT